MRKKTAKNTNFRENLDNFGIDLKRNQETTDRIEKEMVEKLKSFAQFGVKYSNFVKQVQGTNKPETRLMLVPQRPLTRQDLQELEERLTVKKSKKPGKALIVLIFERKTHALFRKDEPEAHYSVARAPLRERILIAIRQDFQKTADLAKNLNSTVKSIQSTIEKINRKAMEDLSLKEKVILGEASAGYRLNPLYSLVKK